MAAPEKKSVDQISLAKGFAFHTKLNPKLWEKGQMLPEVRVSLLRSARAFFDFLDVPGLKIEDIIFTGSNAAYNYTDFSDLDVHLIVDFTNSVCPELADNFFTTKKALWNRIHEVTIRGYGLEMYVEDTSNPVKAQGVYSLLKGKWIKKPKMEKPAWDDDAVAAKVESMADQIDDLLASEAPASEIDRLTNRLRNMRRSGLETGGEFSIENLAFKGLRNLGFLDRLWKAKIDSVDKTLSLEAEFNGI
jgi:hypothetical protein